MFRAVHTAVLMKRLSNSTPSSPVSKEAVEPNFDTVAKRPPQNPKSSKFTKNSQKETGRHKRAKSGLFSRSSKNNKDSVGISTAFEINLVPQFLPKHFRSPLSASSRIRAKTRTRILRPPRRSFFRSPQPMILGKPPPMIATVRRRQRATQLHRSRPRRQT